MREAHKKSPHACRSALRRRRKFAATLSGSRSTCFAWDGIEGTQPAYHLSFRWPTIVTCKGMDEVPDLETLCERVKSARFP
jgi:hypothetical protein